MDSNGTQALIADLQHPRSTKRRAAAKALRRKPDPSAAQSLVGALEAEIGDARTWETQYQMIMALAACGSETMATPLLARILTRPLEPMVWLAAGDALVRLSSDIDGAALAAIASGSLPRIEGAARAIAMMHATPGTAAIHTLLDVASPSAHGSIRFWVAAAAASWTEEDPNVRTFLMSCLGDPSAETRRAAQASLDGNYLKWNPL